jgi:ubiquinone/menaquinone biosynthesis C-methylase UbiE
MEQNKKHNKFDDQSLFWDLESESEDYCADFIRCADENCWLEMLFTVERSKKLLVCGEVLELGGGSQYLSRYLASNRNCNIICTDVSPQRIQDFNKFYNNDLVNLKTDGYVNAEKLPYPDHSFDFIIGEAMLHHIEDFRSAILEINRCLKPNGRAIFLREPVAGLDNILLKRPVKRILERWRPELFERYKDFLVINRYEFDKTYFQWIEDFERGGFKISFYKGWYARNTGNIVKSTMPIWFTCLVSIYLEKRVDLDELDWSKLA